MKAIALSVNLNIEKNLIVKLGQLLITVLMIAISYSSSAQCFWTPINTGDNHTIIIPGSASLTLDGNPLPGGSSIGVFFDQSGTLENGGCVVWNGSGTSLSAWGNDGSNPPIGFAAGEVFSFKVRTAGGVTIDNVFVTYEPMGTAGGLVDATDMYGTDKISMIATLTATSGGSCTSVFTNLQPEICDGDSYLAGGVNQTTSGTYYDTLTAANTCDSIVITQLTVLAPISSTINPSICTGASFTVGSSVYTTSGNYVDVLTTSNGCDSTVNTNLSVTACDCSGDPGGTATLDDCGVCSGGNTGLVPDVDKDCNGDCFGTAAIDNCGVCAGGNTGVTPCSSDCNGDPGGTAVVDDCGVCSGGNTSLTPNADKDCNGDCFGTAAIDNCGVCAGGNTGITPCVTDCNGDPGGTATLDACGVCSGGNTGLIPNADQDCNGDCFGTAFIDTCGVCAGGNTGVTPNNCGTAPCFNPAVCWPFTVTADNHTIIIQTSANPSLNGSPLPVGSFVGVFYDDAGTLQSGGYEEWQGSNTALTAWADDGPPKNGFSNGESFTFKLLLPNGQIVDSVLVTYLPIGSAGGLITHEGTFAIDGISSFATLDGFLSGVNADCNGQPGGGAFIDGCGTCVGGSTGLTPCVADCNGDLGGTAFVDSCGACVGGNTGLTACIQDCNNDWGGIAFIDSCGTCVGGNTGLNPCGAVVDCNGDPGGTATLDDCSVCSGGNTGLTPNADKDCNGDCFGTAAIDNCGVCAGGNTGVTPCVTDCNGDAGGSAFIDTCGVCAGGNTSVTPILIADSCNVGIKESSILQQVRVYPNPFNEEINVEIKVTGAQDVTLRLMDLLGRQISISNLQIADGTNTLRLTPGNELVAGIYLLEIRLADEQGFYKLVK